MTEQYEPSYYEIALTGRQVLAAFVVLLVSMVAAFFSGVWVGRDGGLEAGEPARTVEEARAPTEEETAQMDQLSFFEEEGADGGASPPARERPERAGQSERAEPEVPSEAAETGGSGAPERAPEPVSPQAATAADLADAATNPSGSLSTGDVVIQVFSSSDRSKAEEILERLRAADFRAFISPVEDAGRTLYRVRVGPFEHKGDAERIAARLRQRLDLETWITQ